MGPFAYWPLTGDSDRNKGLHDAGLFPLRGRFSNSHFLNINRVQFRTEGVLERTTLLLIRFFFSY